MAFVSRLRESVSFLRGNILVLTVTQALGTLSRSMAFPYASLYILALGGNPEQIGLITALSPLAGLLMFPVGGYLADHVGRVKLIALSGYFSSAALLLFVVAPNWQVLALATFLRGFMVVQFPATSAIMADSLAPQDRGIGTATMNTISGMVGLVAPFAAGLVLEHAGEERGMRLLYGVMVVIYLINAIVYHRFLRETSEPDERAVDRASLRNTIRDAYRCIPGMLRSLPTSVKALALVVVLGFIANAVASPYWVVYASDKIGLSAASWGLVLLIEMVARIALSIPAGLAVDHLGRTQFVRGPLVVAGIAMALFMFATNFWQVALIRVAIGIANAFFLPACAAMMANGLPRDVRGRAMAALGRGTVMLAPPSGGTGGPGLGLLVIIPVMLSSVLGGYLYARSPHLAWFTGIGAYALALIIAVTMLRDLRQAEA